MAQPRADFVKEEVKSESSAAPGSVVASPSHAIVPKDYLLQLLALSIPFLKITSSDGLVTQIFPEEYFDAFLGKLAADPDLVNGFARKGFKPTAIEKLAKDEKKLELSVNYIRKKSMEIIKQNQLLRLENWDVFYWSLCKIAESRLAQPAALSSAAGPGDEKGFSAPKAGESKKSEDLVILGNVISEDYIGEQIAKNSSNTPKNVVPSSPPAKLPERKEIQLPVLPDARAASSKAGFFGKGFWATLNNATDINLIKGGLKKTKAKVSGLSSYVYKS